MYLISFSRYFLFISFIDITLQMYASDRFRPAPKFFIDCSVKRYASRKGHCQ
jgi:hypothetical protein